MQLIAGRTAQEYNQRKGRRGAFWEDRYHATAVDSDKYLARCMVYIDLNMVRAGVVSHPGEWPYSGYCEIQSPPRRYAVIDRKVLIELLGANDFEQCCQIHNGRVEDELKSALGITGHSRSVVEDNGAYALKEPAVPYTAHLEGEKSVLSAENTVLLE